MSPASAAISCELVIGQSALLSALSVAERIQNDKVIPVYGFMRVDAQGDRLAWAATNGQLWRTGRVPAIVECAGVGLLPITLALAFVKRCPDANIALTFTGDRVAFRAGALHAKWHAWPLEDFPTIPAVPDGGITIGQAALARAIGHVAAIARGLSATKYFMRGAQLAITPDALMCVATDGHRLVRSSLPLSEAAESAESVVPRQALLEAGVMIANAKDGETVRYVNDDLAGLHAFVTADQALLARPVDDKFPAYERLLLTKAESAFTCHRETWLASVQRVALAGDGDMRKMKVSRVDGSVHLSAASANNGEAEERIACADAHGDPVDFIVNPRYLADCLGSLDCEAVRCEIQDDSRPIMFKPVPAEAGDYLCVIMPMRL